MDRMSYLDNVRTIPPRRIWADMDARAVHGEHLTLGILELEPNGHVPEHSHPNEQIGVLVRGSLTWRIGDQTEDLTPGATWCIPGGVPHEANAGPDGAVLIEGFSPPRQDWHRFEPKAAGAPRWPG